MAQLNNTEKIINEIRSLTPNYPGYIHKKEKTYTQKQWEYNMKVSSTKENLRKKSTRLSDKQEEIVSLDELDKILDIESKKVYTKKWSRLGKNFKINRLMEYYDKSFEEVMKVYDQINNKDVEYDETNGKIKNINNNIFKDNGK